MGFCFGVRRAIEMVEKDPRQDRPGNIVSYPIIGSVAAGTPTLAEANIEDRVEMAGGLFGDDSFPPPTSSRKPVMSDTRSGVPHAIASNSVTPNEAMVVGQR